MLTYDRTTIALHWITAGLVALVWGLAQVIDLFPPASYGRIALRSAHVLLGVGLVFVLAARIVWRRRGGVVMPADAGWQGMAARGVHHLLYSMMALLLVSGVLNVWVRGDSFYGLFRFVSFAPGDKAMRQLIGGTHELGANAVLIVAAGHAAMALVHHYVMHDGVLRRILPRA